MKIEILIQNIQHIKKLELTINLNDKPILCITGKNGSGKTTLIKSIKNLISADTFKKTSSARSFSEKSEILYKIDGQEICFKYDKNSNSPAPCKKLLSV